LATCWMPWSASPDVFCGPLLAVPLAAASALLVVSARRPAAAATATATAGDASAQARWEAGFGMLLAACSAFQPTSLTVFALAAAGFKITKATARLAAESGHAMAEAGASASDLALRSRIDTVKREMEDNKKAALAALKKAHEVQIETITTELERAFTEKNSGLRREINDLKTGRRRNGESGFPAGKGW
jgi:hypothetical protein